MAKPFPLDGVRILAIEQYGAGPFGTLFFADQGAEVIKIEDPREGGDYSRTLGPHFLSNGESQFWHTFNRNKTSVTLDLKTPGGQEIFHKLVKTADGVASNSRGDVAEKLGLTFKQLKYVNPKIVCAHLSAYGREGSRANWPGFDFLMQAEAGHFSVTGEPDGPPQRCGLSVVDLAAGLGLAFALAAGIISSRATGSGCELDTSLFHMAHTLNVYTATWYLNSKYIQGRTSRSAHPSLVPCQLFRTSDGWVYLMCNKQRFWPILCDAIGRRELADDLRFNDFSVRLENRKLLEAILDEVLAGRTTKEWLTVFAGKVPSAPVHDLKAALESSFVQEQKMLQEIDVPGHGSLNLLDTPVRSENNTPLNPAPKLGEHTENVLSELGYSEKEIKDFRQAKII
ncbi:MAG: Acetyl-CoA:oxalate CoA-transferase [Alphaproteobacteria bacterium MarineAlpha3_Bin5]|nr:CoA transferase [Magnetovibrio sp.]PPR78559.1 MAG: Acetyl-CoA:oxalate CoA-transferase [Alphaproteobacteria bacterium MarineAlpha3_Bin5]